MGSLINSIADFAGIGPASQQKKGIRAANSIASGAADSNLQLQRDEYERQRTLLEPWRRAGENALLKLVNAPNDQFQQAPRFDFNYSQISDPGTQFRLQEGLNAMNATAAARGGLMSGNALRAGQEYGQNLASQEYQNAFNRYREKFDRQTQTHNLDAARADLLYNRMANLAGIGQATSNQLGGYSSNYAQNAGDIINAKGVNSANSALALGNARSSQYANAGNALGGVLGGALGGPIVNAMSILARNLK
jgi:hypothetical protein